MPGVFERAREDLAGARARLAELTSEDEYRDLRRTTLNAHYTHARYVELIWDALGQLGFSGGRVLEPGCGSGNFIGLAPYGAEMTGIERDRVTAAIAAALYPQAEIRAESFADTRIRAGFFDAAVGNVPFGKFKLSDPGHNPGRRLSIHNHFIVKALALTRPGGMVALLTSRYTMDSRNPEARRQIAGLADLVAAIRLPTNAHRQAAGTDVVTDLLILRRREPGPSAEPTGWELAPEMDLPGGQARVNEYFAAHPELVLGEMRVGRGARNEHDLIVAGPPDAAPGLASALETAVTRARQSGLGMTERAEAAKPAPLAPLAPPGDQIDGLIQALPDGTFTRLAVTDSDLTTLTAQAYRPPATQARELRQLLGLRDTVLALLRAEAATPDDSEEITRLRAQLNVGYGAYLARNGPVKRFTWSASGRTDPATGEEKQIKRRPSQGGFRNDPLYPLVYALEESYDPATRTAVRADIFSQRVVVPEPPLLGADTADEALAICLNAYGEVRLEQITRLLGADSDGEARTELGTLVYDEPGTGRLIWAPLYLSGDVRAKLAAATDAAAADPRFEENVRALREVIPRDLGPAEIEAQLGAGWIAPAYVQQFLRETLGDGAVTVERTRGRKWKVSGGNRRSVAATSTWGTRHVCAHDLTQRLLTGTAEQILVHHTASDGTKAVDHQATEAAKQKARDLADRFSIWVWEDTRRARDLSRVYNDRYNAVVPVSFDKIRLFTPGLSAALTLRKHQPPAIARIIYQGSAGLVHDTGAGKTLETIIGVRERQRLGLSHKPCFVVQKHKLGDFRDEFLRAYPGARLLVADTDDLTGNKRREFIARCATGNPAAIIMSREAFRSIPVSAARIAAFLKDEERALEQAIEDAQNSGEDNRTIKQIEADLLSTQERRKEQVAKIGQDRGLCYEDTGIDYVVVDEARGYRKGPVVSSLPGMADPGSARALDLLLKLGYHKELYGETRVCLADATPFTNRISEIYTWLRYLNPDIEDFDSWVRTFGKMATAYEMTPSGDFKAKARLREIINAVDLHLWLRELTDFRLKGSLDLQLPVMTGGKPEIVQVPAADELIAYADEIAWRYEHLPKGPPKKGEDNHLKIQGDAIKSALDLRLVGRSTSQPQKAEVTADVIFQKWLKHRDDVYRQQDGSEHPVRGSLILVFASLGTPGRTRRLADDQGPGRFGQWDFYTELRTQLIGRGMPGRLIRFIHEAGNAQQKEELYRACRNGEIAVLVGSTEKLGTGTNVQDRAVGLVQVTAPWNWDEPHQELGRVERQGNHNPEFFCIRIVTSPSADAIKWERARQKEHSFRALMSGRIEGRTIRIPDDDLSSAEVMAAASGDLRLLERAELEGTISRLHTLRRAWAQNQTALGYTISSADQQIAGKKQAIGKIDAALRRRKDTHGDAFAMTVDGQRFTKRADAAERLRELLRQRIAAIPRGHIQQHIALGEIGGFTLTATLAPHYSSSIALTLEGIPDLPAPLVLNHRELPEKTGIIARLENRLSGLEQARAEAEAAIEQLTSEIDSARSSIGGSFPQQDEYEQACARLATLEAELVGQSKRADNAAEPGTAETDRSVPIQPPEHGPDDRQAESQEQDSMARRTPAAAPSRPASPGTPQVTPEPDGADADAETGEPQPYERAQPQSHTHTSGHTARPAEPAPAVAAEFAHDSADGPVIEHHQRGTLVHGTEKNDLKLRRLLHEYGFRWSRTLNAWYLPRPWAFSTRDRRVTGLTASLRQAGRTFTLRDQPPAPAATVPGNARGSDAPAASITPGTAQPVTHGPEPSAVPAAHGQTRQGGGASARTAVSSSAPTAPSPHAPADPAPAAAPPAAAPPDAGRQAAAAKARQAHTALQNGDYDRALILLDEAESLYPHRGVHWDAGRRQIRDAMNRAQAQQQAGPEPPGPTAGRNARTDDAGPGAATRDMHAQAAEPAVTARQPAAHGATGPGDERTVAPAPDDEPPEWSAANRNPDTAARPGNMTGRRGNATAETVPGPAGAEPVAGGTPEPTAAPANNGDLAAALRRLPGGEFVRFASGAGTPGPAGSRISRRDGEPDAGAYEELDWDANGIDITIRAPGILRHSLVHWAQAASWIDPGMTPARLGVIIEADLLSNFCRSRREELIAAGNTDPDAAGRELSQIRDDTINTVISTAFSTRGAAAPVPPARSVRPGYQTAAMIVRPGPGASMDENTALERLGQLRAAIRPMQPASDADIKATIRRWIGDGLPEYVRALSKPTAMREWITGQVTARAGRPGHGSYDTPGTSGGLWSGASPEGLLTARDGDNRTETLTPWAEIPAWIQPGISGQCLEQLLAADARHRAIVRRQLLTAAHTLSTPGEQQEQERERERAARRLREALDAAWAAIAAAPAPTPGQCEQARRTYEEDTGPTQEYLFGDETPTGRPGQRAREPAGGPAEPGQRATVPANAAPARQPGDRPAALRTSSAPSAPVHQQKVPAPGSSPPPRAPAEPGDNAQPAAAAARPRTSSSSLTSDDIFLGLRRLPVLGLADLICAMGDGQPLDSLARQMEPRSGERASDEPDAGARETVTCTPQGVRIQVAASSGTRVGLLAWPEVADWLRPGLSPGRLQIMRQAAETRLRLITVNASFRAVGEADLAASAELELRNLISAAVSAALQAARSASAGKPSPGGQQSPPAADEAAALERIGHLASALPAWPPQWRKPLSQVRAGDIIGHPGYKAQPFRVSAQPRPHSGGAEITGHLTRPGEGEPAGEITWTMTINGQADPQVHVVPVPPRSLRPGSPERTGPAAGQQSLAQDSGGGPGTDRTGTRQPNSGSSAIEEEETMPPAPAAEPVPATETPAAPDPGPAQAGSAAREDIVETRAANAPADRADEETRLLRQLDDVLTAIIEHRRAGAQSSLSAGVDFADIRAAFASLRNALELPANGSHPRPGSAVSGPAPAQPPPATAMARHDRPALEADDFDDIRAAFTALKRALDLPAHGRHARTPGAHPGTPDTGAANDQLLDQAVAEAQACAQWYRDTPEWQRITRVSRAAWDLITTIRQASGEYWAEIQQDIRVRGFVRTVTARASLAVSGTAHILAGRLETGGYKGTRIWQAAWGLHRATVTFADQVMRYTPPGRPGRMEEVRHIIDDLRYRPRHSRELGPSRAAGSRGREAGTTSAVALGKEGFPALVPSAPVRHAAAPAARAAAPPLPRRSCVAPRR